MHTWARMKWSNGDMNRQLILVHEWSEDNLSLQYISLTYIYLYTVSYSIYTTIPITWSVNPMSQSTE